LTIARVLIVTLLLLGLAAPVLAAIPSITITGFAYVGPPLVTANAATNLLLGTAALSAAITYRGGSNVTCRGFEWGYATGNYVVSWNETGNFSEGTFAHNVTGLTCNSHVYWRAFAINTQGQGNSSERDFLTTCIPYPPTNFVITQTGASSINISWTMGVGADTITIRGSSDGYPDTVTDGYLVYSGNGTYVVVDGLALSTETYYYRAWSHNTYGYSTGYAEDHIGGSSTSLLILAILALGLTIAMFATKNSMLGFPSGIFWAILAGFAYQQHSVTWDLLYILFFGAIGMAIFSFLAAYALRRRDLAEPDADKGQFIDESRQPTDSIEGSESEEERW